MYKKSSFPKLNAAIQKCYEWYVAMRMSFRNANKFDLAMRPPKINFLDFRFWMFFMRLATHIHFAMAAFK